MPDLHTSLKTAPVNKKPPKATGYWKKQLAGAPKQIEFTASLFHHALHHSKLSSSKFFLPELCRNNLNIIGNQYGATLPVILLTAFKTLLYRHTNQPDLVVTYGTDDNGTDNGSLIEIPEQLLPIRTILAENPAFIDVLEQVQQTVNAAFDHKDEAVGLFTETLIADTAPFSLFQQVIFAFRDTPEAGIANDTTADFMEKHHQAANADLILFIANTANGLECELKYRSSLFEADNMNRMAAHFSVLLDEIIADPAQKITQIPILSGAERHTLLVEWNNTGGDFPLDKCIQELFEEQVRLTPNAIAAELHSGVRTSSTLKQRALTYAELNERANQVAHYLQSIGVGPDVIVGICMKRSLEMVIALLGILKAGGAYLPLDPAHPKDRLNFILKDSGISIILSQSHLIDKLPGIETRVVCLDAERYVISSYSDENSRSQVGPENLAYVIYTSGSTGLPKGTLIIHRGVVNYLSWCTKAYQLDEGNGCPVNSSIGFDATVTSFLAPLLAGKKIVLLPEEGEIEALVAVLQAKNKFSLIKITPAHLEILSNLLPDKNADGQTNALVIGGEALTGKNLSFWRKHAPATRLINEYGPTETVVGCCMYEVSAEKSLTENIPIGRPIANTQIYILDNYMQPVPIGVAGEIYIGGTGLARGYLNRPELTSQRFISNPFHTDPNARLYKTGDTGRYLNDGNIEYIGRVDNQVKIRGYRIELGEIEHSLQQMEWVSQAVVLAGEDKEGGKRLVGYYVPDATTVKSRERELHEQWVANWKGLYETEYGQTEGSENIDPEFNIIGWNDSFTGQPIPAPQMKEWLDDIAGVVLSERPENVLEIGCGTGLIYYQLAGKVNKYIGSDLSTSSIKQINERISKKERNYGETELFTAPAHTVTLQQGQQVDTILLNSMVQYFPGEDYMNAVMGKCMAIINGKGRIIIGDVRDNRLLQLFKSRLRMQKTPDSASIKEFKWDLEQDLIKEEELCFSPVYFYGLREMYPQITHIEIQWKKADYTNELSLYRYTVIIYIGIEKDRIMPQWQSWDGIIDKNHIFSANGHQRNVVALSDIPNPRLWKERLLQKALQDTSIQTVSEMMQVLKNEDPETIQVKQLLQIAKSKGYSHKLLVHEDPLKMNLLFEINPQQGFIQQPLAEKKQFEDEPKTNIPLFSDISFLLRKDIRKALLNRLPEYMVPSEFVALRQFPLTINGKVDRAALQVPDQQQQDSQQTFIAPRSKLESDLTKLLEQTLRINKIGIQDDLFELGINSMQAYRLFSQIKKITKIQLPLSILIEAPTIERLAIYLEGKEANLPWSSIVPIQPKGSKPPLYLVHAGAGTVLFYRDLSRYLGEDQPVYGIQPQGMDGKQHFHNSVEEMAQHYVKEIRTVNPEGPYLLGGYCFGAVIAFEMAHQFINQGSEVAILANFNGVSPTYDYRSYAQVNSNQNPEHIESTLDSYSASKTNVATQISAVRKVRHILGKVKQKVKRKLRYFLINGWDMLITLPYKGYRSLGLRAPEQLTKYYLLASNTEMSKVYQPKPYPGNLTIFRSPEIYHDRHLGWSKFITGDINTCDIPGNHRDRRQILHEPFVEYTAIQLKKCIQQALPTINSGAFTHTSEQLVYNS